MARLLPLAVLAAVVAAPFVGLAAPAPPAADLLLAEPWAVRAYELARDAAEPRASQLAHRSGRVETVAVDTIDSGGVPRVPGHAAFAPDGRVFLAAASGWAPDRRPEVVAWAPNGSRAWHRAYDVPGGVLAAVLLDDGGGLLAVGDAPSPGGGRAVLLLDVAASDGALRGQRLVGPGDGQVRVRQAVRDGDDVLVLGSTYRPPSTSEAWVLVLRPDGSARTLPVPLASPYDIAVEASGTWLVSGLVRRDLEPYQRAVLLRVDDRGEVLARAYPLSPLFAAAPFVTAAPDGGAVVAMHLGFRGAAIRLDAALEEVWRVTDLGIELTDAVFDDRGGVVLAGIARSPATGLSVVLARFDEVGDPLFVRFIDRGAGALDVAFGDGGLALVTTGFDFAFLPVGEAQDAQLTRSLAWSVLGAPLAALERGHRILTR